MFYILLIVLHAVLYIGRWDLIGQAQHNEIICTPSFFYQLDHNGSMMWTIATETIELG